MSELIALSFDCPTTPLISLKQITAADSQKKELHGWGFAWYPEEDFGAAVIKDTKSKTRTLLSQVLQDWKRFHSTLFLCQLRGAAKLRSQQDTQPFHRSYAGRDWIFSHNGELSHFQQSLNLGSHPLFEPLGKTDSEHAFCWLLTQLNQQKIRSLNEIKPEQLQTLFHTINQLGTANLVFSDGDTIAVYNDRTNFNPIYYQRSHPPHSQSCYHSSHTTLDLEDENTALRTYCLFTTYRSFFPNHPPMASGQLILCRRSKIFWDSAWHQLERVAEPPPSELKSKRIVETCHYEIKHITQYQYQRPVESSKHFIRLHPVHDRYQQCLTHTLDVSTDNEHEIFDDVFGNRTSLIRIDKPYTQLEISLTTRVAIQPMPTTLYSHLQPRQTIPLLWLPWQRQMMLPYLLPPELPETQLSELTDYAMSFVKRNRYDVLQTLQDMNQTIYQDYEYVAGSTTLHTTPFEVYNTHEGVCQDFANLLICLSRLLSIPARYRTGYIYTGRNYQNTVQSEASHAWVEVYLPWIGWRGLDPTNGCMAGQDHIRVACGRNYYDATPTQGTLFKGGGKEDLNVNVKVEYFSNPVKEN